jgi:hypothetical protein
MRKLIAIGLLAGMIATAHGAEQLSVAQLEQKLDASLKLVASAGTGHEQNELLKGLDLDAGLPVRDPKEDSDLAEQVYRMELTERLTAKTLNRILATYQPGLETDRALVFLKDRSAFLDPPQAEWISQAAPDAESQGQALELARAYVFQMLLRLPNFFAKRTTTRLEIGPQAWGSLALPDREKPHPAGSSVLEITFRDGKEFVTPVETAGQGSSPADEGLMSWG